MVTEILYFKRTNFDSMTFLVINSSKIAVFTKRYYFYHLHLHSGQIYLFFLKTDHFPTYFLCKIGYNNIPRPVHDPLRPLTTTSPKSVGRDPHPPRIDAYDVTYMHIIYAYTLLLQF